jgi:regulator of sigma E protease
MTVAWFLVAICILVAIHEFGHFIVARWCGVKVLRFSIGFGPRLLTVNDRSGTEFALSAVPLGGYVKMLDEREVDVADEDKPYSYNSKSVAQRIAIAAAGPAANILLAFLFYWVIFLRGTVAYVPVIGNVEPASLAAQAGLQAMQEIVAIDGKPVNSRREVALALVNRLGESGTIDVDVLDDETGVVASKQLVIDKWMRGVEEPDPLRGIGIEFYFPPIGSTIGQIVEGGAAQRAGLRVGDELLTANGESVADWQQWVKLIRNNPQKPIDVTLDRGGNELALMLIPEMKKENGTSFGYAGVGVELPVMPDNMRRIIEHNPLEAIAMAGAESWDTAGFVLLSMKKLLFGEISIKNLSGPIGIAKVAADQAQYGFWAFISFLAHVSVVLAVINILPVPVLDGGHILFCIVEWVKGSPLSEQVQLAGLKLGMALLMCMMVVAFYNDISRL